MRQRTSVGKRDSELARRDEYLELVRRLPLRPIRTVTEYDAAAELLDALVLQTSLSDGEKDYVEALSVFIEDYDRRHKIFDTSGRTPLDMLRHLMEANDLDVTGLGRLFGSKGIASEILSGKRSLSKSHMFKLAERFSVDPGLLLERPRVPQKVLHSHSSP
jgi:HTH-type transcriptional regulator/antitoxin HigA